jgi:hypothetical protein
LNPSRSNSAIAANMVESSRSRRVTKRTEAFVGLFDAVDEIEELGSSGQADRVCHHPASPRLSSASCGRSPRALLIFSLQNLLTPCAFKGLDPSGLVLIDGADPAYPKISAKIPCEFHN